MAKRKRKQKQSLSSLLVLAVVFIAAMGIQHFVDKNDGSSSARASETVLPVSETQDNLSVSSSLVSSDGLELPALSDEEQGVLLKRRGYTLLYNTEWKIPQWVAWKLTAARLQGKAKRTDDFLPDPDLPEKVRSLDKDYAGSRYDRGHMAPAGDMKWDEQAMAESFYLSNICPQASNLNRGDWRELEEKCRVWAQEGEELYIVCGPVVKEGVRHKRVGKSKVLVPEGFFKVLLVMGEQPRAVGFLYPNDDCDAPLASYAVPVDSVEQVTGIDFYPALPDETEKRLEAVRGEFF